jgi:predicted dehydrogenase
LHAPVALAALRARKHVLVEKPMATNATDAAEMVDTAEKVGRKLMVSQNFRFHRQTQIARKMIESGALGEIYHAAGQWLRRAGIPRIGSWFTQKQTAGGGCTMDIGVHMIDTALYLLGEFDVTTVSAQTRAAFGPRGLGDGNWGQSEIDPAAIFDVEDFSVALLRLRSGRSVLLRTAWAANLAPEYREHHLELFGTEGGLGVFPARLFRSTALGYESTELDLSALPYPEDRIHHFIQCIVEDSQPLVGMGESLQVQKVLDAIYQSAAQGREVALG